jgi:UDP-2,3-diacylglucosamine hydrolase
MRGYKIMRAIFHNRFLQILFSGLHPWFAFRLGNGWSRRSRLAKDRPYVFRGADEPLYRWAVDFAAKEKVDYFIFGHYHAPVDLTLPDGARLMVLKDWMESSPYFLFDGAEVLTCLT